MMRYFLSAVALALALPVITWAEGDKRIIACTASKICDQLGACQPSDTKITLSLSPIKRGPNGEGPHWIEYSGQKYKADNVTGRGPVVWSTDGTDVQTLLFAGENETLWHRLVFSPDARSSLEFLTCKDAS